MTDAILGRRRPHQMAILAVAILFTAGCVSRSSPPPENHPEDGALPSNGTLTIPALDLTSCKGAVLVMEAPSSWLDAALPDAYTANELPTSPIFIEFTNCQKIALDGVDSGPASFAFLAAVVKPPSKSTPGNHRANWYAFEVRTDNVALENWFAMNAQKPARGVVGTTFQPQPGPSPWGESTAKLSEDSTVIYEAKSAPYKELGEAQALIRMFYGADPTTDFWQMRHSYKHSRSFGVGVLSADPSSTFAKTMNGVTEWQGLGAATETTYRSIRPHAVEA